MGIQGWEMAGYEVGTKTNQMVEPVVAGTGKQCLFV